MKSVLKFSTPLEAWEGLNRSFLLHEDLNFKTGNGASYVYDLVLKIKHGGEIPEDFDFGKHFDYYITKWNTLCTDYLDMESLNEAKSEWEFERSKESKKQKNVINIPIYFAHRHKNSKRCLLAGVISKRVRSNTNTLTIFLRASEVTKRLMVDLVLFARIGEYIFSNKNFELVVHFNQIFNDDTVLLMYHTYESIFDILRDSNTERSKNIKEELKKLLEVDPKKVKYKVYKRILRVLRPGIYKEKAPTSTPASLFQLKKG